MACLLNVLPDGYGYGKRVMHRMCIDAELNDVRQPNSSLLEFYFEVGLRFQSPRAQQLSFLSIGNPHYMNSACDGCGQWNKNGVYFFQPRLQNAIEYFQVQMDRSGELAWAFVHTHQNWGTEVWMLSGNLEQAGLAPGQYSAMPLTLQGKSHWGSTHAFRTDMKYAAQPLEVQAAQVDEVKNYITAHVSRSGQSWICTQASAPLTCSHNQWYDRQSGLVCPDGWQFKHGDWVTFVVFHSNWNTAASKANGPGPDGSRPVHLIWRMMFIPLKNINSTYGFITAKWSGIKHVMPSIETPSTRLTNEQLERDVCPQSSQPIDTTSLPAAVPEAREHAKATDAEATSLPAVSPEVPIHETPAHKEFREVTSSSPKSSEKSSTTMLIMYWVAGLIATGAIYLRYITQKVDF